MDLCSPLGPLLWALALQVARMASAEQAPTQNLTYQVDDVATLSLEAPQRSSISSLLWRTSSRGSHKAVATWDPENSLNVLNPSYSRRVAFHKESWTLEIHNLSQADGGQYEVLERRDPSDRLLKKYTLVVFKISTDGSGLENGSCRVSLLCEAGVGANTQVGYSWGPGHPGSALHLTLPPNEKDKSYTCTATALGTSFSRKVTPCSSSANRAAGLLGGPALLLALLLLPLLQ